MDGVCSPAGAIQYREENGALISRLGDFTINKFAKGEAAAYPTLCKGRYQTDEGCGYLFEDPASLDATTMLPELRKANVSALKIEGRQRGRAYIERVVKTFRNALTALDEGRPIPADELNGLSEGQSTTVGAYKKTWR
jgi:putative protease